MAIYLHDQRLTKTLEHFGTWTLGEPPSPHFYWLRIENPDGSAHVVLSRKEILAGDVKITHWQKISAPSPDLQGGSVNPNDAPPGLTAFPARSPCESCLFEHGPISACPRRSNGYLYCGTSRADKKMVIFNKKVEVAHEADSD